MTEEASYVWGSALSARICCWPVHPVVLMPTSKMSKSLSRSQVAVPSPQGSRGQAGAGGLQGTGLLPPYRCPCLVALPCSGCESLTPGTGVPLLCFAFSLSQTLLQGPGFSPASFCRGPVSEWVLICLTGIERGCCRGEKLQLRRPWRCWI